MENTEKLPTFSSIKVLLKWKAQKRSYYSKEKISSSIGVTAPASTFSFSLEEDLYSLLEMIEQNRKSAQKVFLKLNEDIDLFKKTPANSSPINISEFSRLFDNLTQQHLLEENVCQLILKYNETNENQDALVTMIACFKYNPYFSDADFDLLIQ